MLYSLSHPLFPAVVGNYWKYKLYTFKFENWDSSWTYKDINSFGFNVDSLTNFNSYVRREVVDSLFITLNDTIYQCYVFDTYDYRTNEYRGFYYPYWIGEDGVYEMGIFNLSDSLFHKGLRIPSKISLYDIWKGQLSYRLDTSFKTSFLDEICLSKSEIIQTPIGKVSCYVIKARMQVAEDVAGYYDFYYYYTPNIGLVCKIRLYVMGDEKMWALDYISMIQGYSIK